MKEFNQKPTKVATDVIGEPFDLSLLGSSSKPRVVVPPVDTSNNVESILNCSTCSGEHYSFGAIFDIEVSEFFRNKRVSVWQNGGQSIHSFNVGSTYNEQALTSFLESQGFQYRSGDYDFNITNLLGTEERHIIIDSEDWQLNPINERLQQYWGCGISQNKQIESCLEPKSIEPPVANNITIDQILYTYDIGNSDIGSWNVRPLDSCYDPEQLDITLDSINGVPYSFQDGVQSSLTLEDGFVGVSVSVMPNDNNPQVIISSPLNTEFLAPSNRVITIPYTIRNSAGLTASANIIYTFTMIRPVNISCEGGNPYLNLLPNPNRTVVGNYSHWEIKADGVVLANSLQLSPYNSSLENFLNDYRVKPKLQDLGLTANGSWEGGQHITLDDDYEERDPVRLEIIPLNNMAKDSFILPTTGDARYNPTLAVTMDNQYPLGVAFTVCLAQQDYVPHNVRIDTRNYGTLKFNFTNNSIPSGFSGQVMSAINNESNGIWGVYIGPSIRRIESKAFSQAYVASKISFTTTSKVKNSALNFIADDAFTSVLSNIDRILPEGIEEIPVRCFDVFGTYPPSLKRIRVDVRHDMRPPYTHWNLYCTEPPTFLVYSGVTFNGTSTGGGALRVPPNLVSAYANQSQWGRLGSDKIYTIVNYPDFSPYRNQV